MSSKAGPNQGPGDGDRQPELSKSQKKNAKKKAKKTGQYDFDLPLRGPAASDDSQVGPNPLAESNVPNDDEAGRVHPKEYAKRPGFGNSQYEVLTNHFNIRLDEKKLKKGELCLYVYQITNIDQNHTRAKRKKLVEAAVQLCSLLRDSPGCWVTDNMEKVVSWINLSPSGQDLPSGTALDTFVIKDGNKLENKTDNLHSELQFVRKIDLNDMINYVNGHNKNFGRKQEAIAAVNLFFTKHLFNDGQCNIRAGTNRFFLEDGFVSIDSRDSRDALGKAVCRGYTFQVRPAIDQLMLNINASTSLFYERGWTVAKYISLINRKDLIGVRVQVKLDAEPARTKTIYEFGSSIASQTYFNVDEGGVPVRWNVWDYMKQKYNSGASKKSAGSPHSICINTNPKTADSKTWFLAEDLEILPHQMYKPKLTPELTSLMIKKACRKPTENIRLIEHEGLRAMGAWKNQKGPEQPLSFQGSGIRIDPRMFRVRARLIEPPQFEFKMFNQSTNQMEARDLSVVKSNSLSRGTWHLQPDWGFLSTSQAPTDQPFFLIPPRFSKDELQYFWSHYNRHGAPDLGNLPNQFDITNCRTIDDPKDIEKAVDAASKSKPSIVIMILPGKSNAYLRGYAAFKTLVDQKYGLPSLCLSWDKLDDRNRNSADPTNPRSHIANYAYNVGMKLNVRFGNTNHSIATSNFQILQKDEDGNLDTMILGADVIHPGASRIEGTPSIAALVGSVDEKYGKYLGSMRMQPYDPKTASKEVIENDKMRDMARERLEAWKKVNGRHPGKILYYRDGVGDGQFDAVLDKEVAMIRKAYEEAVTDTSQEGTKPQITALVVVKRHNVRLYPIDPAKTSTKDSCLPGTVVDSGITHPYNFDFFLISHDALHGTARPTHYVVLLNELGLDATEVQNLTHSLCYTYQRSTTSVSYVPPAYYADHLCERGRCYLMGFYDGTAVVDKSDPNVVEQEVRKAFERGGRHGGNPWHANMDDKMFWM